MNEYQMVILKMESKSKLVKSVTVTGMTCRLANINFCLADTLIFFFS